MLTRSALIARSVGQLRWQQVAYRLLRRLQPRGAPARALPMELAPSVDALQLAIAAWADTRSVNMASARAVARDEFEFLNLREHISSPDWRRRYVSHLWNYNLHYFDYAVDLALAWRQTRDDRLLRAFEGLALSWADGTADGKGDGWEPYPLSLRIVNWTYALLLFGNALSLESSDRLRSSLHRQLVVLANRLEWHIMANHLQKNLHALLVGSLLFSDKTAERCRAVALRHLWRELDEQVLPDGVHYERSPMYHAIALGDALEDLLLCDAAGIDVPRAARERVGRMVAALTLLTRDDGRLHLLNDAANGVAPSTDELMRLATLVFDEPVTAASVGNWSLADAGYFGIRDDRSADALIIDCGEPGPSYQPGHAHCDLLSYELDVGGHPVVVDSGVHGYDNDPYREFVRSTRAHNTVMIAGKEQAELWSTFRMARRPRVLGADVHEVGSDWHFRGSYHPYHDRRATHTREVDRSRDAVIVKDRVTGAAGKKLESFIHLHPDFQVRAEDGRVRATAPGVTVIIEPFHVDVVTLLRGESNPVQGWYCPEFGVALSNPVIVMTVNANRETPFGYRISFTRDPSPSA